MCPCNSGLLSFAAPVAVLITISFFVLVVLQKITLKGLIILGKAAVILLWLAALLIGVSGIYRACACPKSFCPMSTANKPAGMMGMGDKKMMDDSGYPPEMIEMMQNKGK